MAQVKFCTYFDHHYLDRGLVLYESLRRHYPGAVMHVLALSKECEEFLKTLNLAGVVIIPLAKILDHDSRLADAQKNRTNTEFIFTLTPYIVQDTLKEVEDGGQAIYLDADMMFFGSPTEVLRESQDFDVAITPHNFSAHMESQKRFGIYNVGWVGFKKSPGGERCARWWAESCLEWCHDRLENGKFADQKYLENFENIADSVYVINHIGVNCAPWNASGRRFAKSGNQVLVDDVPLILYHFAKVQRINPSCLATRIKIQGVMGAKGINQCVYKAYAIALNVVSAKYSMPSAWIFQKSSTRTGAKHKNLQNNDNLGKISVLKRVITGDCVVSRLQDVWDLVINDDPISAGSRSVSTLCTGPSCF